MGQLVCGKIDICSPFFCTLTLVCSQIFIAVFGNVVGLCWTRLGAIVPIMLLQVVLIVQA